MILIRSPIVEALSWFRAALPAGKATTWTAYGQCLFDCKAIRDVKTNYAASFGAITLTDNVKDEDMTGTGGTNDRSDRGIMMMGGTLSLHGNRTNYWTKLSKTRGRQQLD